MRVLIDTNVFISYLLTSHGSGAIQAIFEAWSQAAFTLLLPEALLDEVLVTVTGRPHLSKRIPPNILEEFLAMIKTFGETVPQITVPIPAVTRDPDDDYLLAYALVGAADYLVTGDKDLLTLNGTIPELRILSPRQFREVLQLPR